jgi:L-amino acid N-acyltransferase YncA
VCFGRWLTASVKSEFEVQIRSASIQDAEEIAAIYAPYIRATDITFEETEVSAAEMAERIQAVQGASLPWLVMTEQQRVLGYAYASPWHKRSAFRHTVESSIYLDAKAQGRGLGKLLYTELLNQLRACGKHSVIGAVALPNDASVQLHEQLGFKQVGELHQAGYKLGRWVNLGYWQLML